MEVAMKTTTSQDRRDILPFADIKNIIGQVSAASRTTIASEQGPHNLKGNDLAQIEAVKFTDLALKTDTGMRVVFRAAAVDVVCKGKRLTLHALVPYTGVTNSSDAGKPVDGDKKPEAYFVLNVVGHFGGTIDAPAFAPQAGNYLAEVNYAAMTDADGKQVNIINRCLLKRFEPR